MIGPLRSVMVRTLDPDRSLRAYREELGLRVDGPTTVEWLEPLIGTLAGADVWLLRAAEDEVPHLRLVYAPGGRAGVARRAATDIGPMGISWRADGVLESWDRFAAGPYRPYSKRPSDFTFMAGAVRFHEILVSGPDNVTWALMETIGDTTLPRRTRRLFVNTNIAAEATEPLAIYRDLMGFGVRSHYEVALPEQFAVFGLDGGHYTFDALRAPSHLDQNALGINSMVFDVPNQQDLRATSGPAYDGRCLDAYETDDLDGFWHRLQDSPVAGRVVSPPIDLPGTAGGPLRALTFRGPFGSLIEIGSYA